jgi:hypothetical protein
MVRLASPDLGDIQFQLAHPRRQLPRLAAVAVTLAILRPFMRGGVDMFGRLGLHHLLDHFPQKRLQPVVASECIFKQPSPNADLCSCHRSSPVLIKKFP